MQHEFTERLQSIAADIKALQGNAPDASIPASLQARLDNIRNELEAMTAELTDDSGQKEQTTVLRSEAKYRTLFETTTEGFCIIEMVYNDSGEAVDFRYLEVNPVFEQQTGLKNVVSRLGSEIVPGTEHYWIDNYEQVARTGEPHDFENYHEVTGRWYSAHASRVGGADSQQVAILFTDITERKRHEQQQAYLLRLSDALRPLSDPIAIQRAAMTVVGEHLQADRVLYVEFDFENQIYLIGDNYVSAGIPKRVGRFPISTFSGLIEWFSDGKTYLINDVRDTTLLTDTEKQAAIAAGVQAVLGVPLMKDGQLVAHLGIQQGQPRNWTADEIELVRETGERTWAAVERARAQEALRKSEEAMQLAMLINRIVTWEWTPSQDSIHTSNSFNEIYGQPALAGPAEGWALVLPEDQEAHVAKVRRITAEGGTYVSEFRIKRPVDGRIVWLEERAEAQLDAQGKVQRVIGIASDITERKHREQQQQYLLKLSDALRPLSDPDAVQDAAARILGEELRVKRAFYFDAEPEGESYVHIIHREYYRTPAMRQIAGRYPQDVFGKTFFENLVQGKTLVVNDIKTTSLLTPDKLHTYQAEGWTAFITVPLLKNGQYVGGVCILDSSERKWTATEISMVEETAERTWAAVERARAETAEREQRLLAEALRDTAIELSRTLNMDEVLEAALAAANRIVPFDTGLIILTEEGAITQFHTMGLKSRERGILERWHQKQINIDDTAVYQMAASDHKPVLLQTAELRSLRLPAAFGSALLVKPMQHNDNVIGYFTLISHDSSRFSEKDFQKLQALAYQVVIAVESAKRFEQAQELAVLQERNMIARELHDAVTQTLFSTSIITEAMARHVVQRNPEDLAKMLSSVHRLVQSAMAEMRTLLLELRPMHIYSTPFKQLMEQLMQAAMGRKSVDGNLKFEGEPSIPEAVHFAFYRIAQEAVNNILKHANAKQISISGHGGTNFIDLRIHDDGAGFDTNSTSGGMGLSTMRERAAEVGAQLTVHSIVGDGTEIRIVWKGNEG